MQIYININRVSPQKAERSTFVTSMIFENIAYFDFIR